MSSLGVTIGRQSILRDLLILPGLLTATANLTGLAPELPVASAAGIAWSLWIVASILLAAFRAMAHADHLAELLGEPIGTIVLTISAITIEVAAICAIMLHATSQEEAVVVRDTMFAVLMIILNGLIGTALLVGGLLRREQVFNLQSSAAYVPLIVALATITLVLPRFTRSQEGGWMSDPMEIFVGAASLVVYLAFLWLQTSRHREFFAFQENAAPVHASTGPPPIVAESHHHGHHPGRRRAIVVSSRSRLRRRRARRDDEDAQARRHRRRARVREGHAVRAHRREVRPRAHLRGRPPPRGRRGGHPGGARGEGVHGSRRPRAGRGRRDHGEGRVGLRRG